MGLKVVTVTNKPAGHYLEYMEQLEEAGIQHLPVYIERFNWANRLSMYYEVARRNLEDVLIFTDAWDVLFFPPEGELEFPHPTDYILFSAEKNVWPAGTSHDVLKGGVAPNSYINAGMFMATGRVLVDFMRDHNMQCLGPEIDDQAIWHHMADIDNGFNNFRLDGKCEIFQNLYLAEDDVVMEKGRPKNKVYGTYPRFIHGNGGVSLDRFLV